MPLISSNVFKQRPGETLADIPIYSDNRPQDEIRFRHIMHAFRGSPRNQEIQNLTFESIRTAQQFDRAIKVVPVVVLYEKDHDVVPLDLLKSPDITRTVSEFSSFKIQRDLPLLFDIVEHGQSVTLDDDNGIEFTILTNSDIHLQPFFYRAILDLIDFGYDVITVNRRTVPWSGSLTSRLIFAEHGADHLGFDCFVFPSHYVKLFERSDACCGMPHVMRSLLYNLVARANHFLMLTQAHLTCHIGDDQRWSADKFADYEHYNIERAKDILGKLSSKSIEKKRLSEFVMIHEMDTYKDFLKSRDGFLTSVVSRGIR